jgi:hypothetical protein
VSTPATSLPGGILARDPVAGDAGRWKPWRSSLLVESVVTTALGAIVFFIGFGGDLRRLAGPLSGGDLLEAYATAKFWSDGTPFGNNTLGYPFGVELRYFPTADILPNSLAGVISAIFQNPFVGLNLVYALSFPLVALAALWVFRIVRVRGPIAIFGSLAFTAIPYHWLRLEHLYLATMYSAVFGVGLALLTGTGAIERRLAGPRRWPTIVLLGTLSLVVATGGIYYACFTILLCSAALIYRLAHRPSWRGALLSAIPLMSVPVFLGAALTPAFIFVRANPPIQEVAHRLVIESVTYSGNLAFALIPAPFTQIPGLKSLNPSIEHAFAVASASGTSGVQWYADFGSLFSVLALLLGGIGLFWSVRRVARGAMPHEPNSDKAQTDTNVSFGLVGLLLVTTVLFFVPWGLNVMFAALITPQLRGWDRLVPVILLLFFAAAMVAWRSMGIPQRGRGSLLIATGCLVLLIFDSVAPYQAFFAQAASAGQENLRSGDRYADVLNAAIPGKCAMLQLPYLGFPEQPPLHTLGAYDPLLTALTNPDKEWTFGAVKGTLGSEWQGVLGSDIDASAVSDLVAGGFCGIHVDRRGLTASEDVQVTKRLSKLLGKPIATGHGGDWAAYALPAAGPHQVVDVLDAAKLPHQLAAFFYPPVIAPHDGDTTVGVERDAFGPGWRATAERTEFAVESLVPAAEFSTVTGTLRAGDCAPRDVKLELRNGKEAITASFHLTPSEEHDFTLKFARKAADAELVVSAPGALCTNAADQSIFTVALLDTKAR